MTMKIFAKTCYLVIVHGIHLLILHQSEFVKTKELRETKYLKTLLCKFKIV